MSEKDNRINPQENRETLTNSNNIKEPKKKDKKYYGKLLIVFIFGVLCVIYYIYVYETMWKNLKPSNLYIISTLLVIFHLLLFFFLLAFYHTMEMQPGSIPLYWGFYIGDDDYKRKRYCLICNAFKPERSHHCSVCNTCVLNMDHHCPWVDNCIGFYNRKFFMQLLFYVCLLTIYVDISMAYFAYLIVRDIFRMKLAYNNSIHAALILSGYCLVFGFSIIITRFFNFHINLVLTNSTTIESLDKDHKEENRRFCLSQKENWEQVFGSSLLLWFIPMDLEKGRPVGDGLTWPIREEDDTHNLQNNNVAPNAISNLVQQQEPNNNVEQSNKQNIEMRNMANYNTNFASTSPMSPQGGI